MIRFVTRLLQLALLAIVPTVAAVPPAKVLLPTPPAFSSGLYGYYATLALGSALALFLYPHSITGILSASSGQAIRRNAALLLAVLGFMAGNLYARRGGLHPARALQSGQQPLKRAPLDLP